MRKKHEERTYLAQRSTVRGFIRNKTTLQDLEELEKLIKERKKPSQFEFEGFFGSIFRY